MKGCMCHFKKWLIHPFISKETIYSGDLQCKLYKLAACIDECADIKIYCSYNRVFYRRHPANILQRSTQINNNDPSRNIMWNTMPIIPRFTSLTVTRGGYVSNVNLVTEFTSSTKSSFSVVLMLDQRHRCWYSVKKCVFLAIDTLYANDLSCDRCFYQRSHIIKFLMVHEICRCLAYNFGFSLVDMAIWTNQRANI